MRISSINIQHIEPPTLVRTEEGLLVPYKFTEKSFIGESSAINSRTPRLFYSCFQKRDLPSLDSKDFIKTAREKIFHLQPTFHHLTIVNSESEESRYLRLSGRAWRELEYENENSDEYIKPWNEMTQEERKEEMRKKSFVLKRDLTKSLLDGIYLSAQSDAIKFAQDQKLRKEEWHKILFEINFSQQTFQPMLDIYSPKTETL